MEWDKGSKVKGVHSLEHTEWAPRRAQSLLVAWHCHSCRMAPQIVHDASADPPVSTRYLPRPGTCPDRRPRGCVIGLSCSIPVLARTAIPAAADLSTRINKQHIFSNCVTGLRICLILQNLSHYCSLIPSEPVFLHFGGGEQGQQRFLLPSDSPREMTFELFCRAGKQGSRRVHPHH